MDLNPAITDGWLDGDLLARLGVATLLGMLLGLDREWRGHSAGIRTHALLALASAALSVSVVALDVQLASGRSDALRLFEAAASFAAIIGAGLIVFSRGRIRNLTTTANLWLTTVVGIGCGLGQWPLVLATSLIGGAVLTLLRFVEPLGREQRRIGTRDGED